MVIPAEDDDVARERELIQSKPVSVLQKDNNLVIKWEISLPPLIQIQKSMSTIINAVY